jgi:hypothetical protein
VSRPADFPVAALGVFKKRSTALHGAVRKHDIPLFLGTKKETDDMIYFQ